MSGGSRSWRDLVVVRAANRWDGVRFQDRQLAENLAPQLPVLYVDPPRSFLSRHRRPELAMDRSEATLREVADGIVRLTPFVLPGMERRGMARITEVLLGHHIRSAVATLGGSVDTVIESSPVAPAMGHCGERCSLYWAQDDYVGMAELLGLSRSRMDAGERRQLRRANVVVAANPDVAERLRSLGADPELIPFGCDAELFATTDSVIPAPDVTVPRPIAGFMGHLGSRIDLALLEAIADRGISLLLVGPRHPKFEIARMDSLLARPNVQWLGGRPFEELPTYLAHVDVGLVPYDRSPFNLGSFPLKTLEYLAAGRAVVATELPAIRWLVDEQGAGDHIGVSSQPQGYAEEVEARLHRPLEPDAMAKRRAFADRHSWPRRAQAFAEAIGRPIASHNALSG